MKYIKLFLKKTLRYLLKPLSFLPALFVMYMIFSFSAQDGATSAGLSRRVSIWLVEAGNKLLHKDFSAAQILAHAEQIHFYVRKLGHITEYFILAVSIAFPLYVYRVRGIRLILFAGAFCVGFAGLDEYHQSFVAGRGPSSRDVAIDSIGIFSGIILTQIVCFIGRKTIFSPLSLPRKK